MTGGLTQTTLAWLCASPCAIPMSSHVCPNSALLTDASTSPLRARRGAAKRERYMARMRGVICSSVLLLFAAFPSHAVADYKRCFEAGNTIEINDCLGDEFHKVHKELEQTYRRTIKALSPDAGKALDEAQQIWIQFRDKECLAVYEFWKAGTIRTTKA